MMRFIMVILVALVMPTFLQSMKIPKAPEPELSRELLLKKAIHTIEQKNPSYTLFNGGDDIRCLDFLTYHLERAGRPLDQKRLKRHEMALRDLYLISLKHKNSINDPSLPSLTFIVDADRLYIKQLKKYPTTIQDKIASVSFFLKKVSINQSCLVKKIPQDLHESLRKAFVIIETNYADHRLLKIDLLDKREEKAGYFVVFRLKKIGMQGVHHVVYELCKNKVFEWDKACSNNKEYYERYQKYFKDVAAGLRI